MAVSIVMTGTTQSINATNGSSNVTFTAGVATNWVVGATVQGTGWATGTKIVSITGTPATSTAAVLSNNFTGTSGTSSVIVSSNNSTLTVSLTASGDTASPTNIISAGVGILRGNKTLEILGATKIVLQIATGAVYDDTEWCYELGAASSLRFNESYGCGTWRSGWILQGSTYVKAKGHTVNYSNFDGSNNAGGRTIFFNSGAPTGYPTSKPTVHWNDTGWYAAPGTSNGSAIPAMQYGQWSPPGLSSGRLVFDYQNDSAGANSGFGGSFGTIESVLFNRCIGGISTGADTASLVSIGKFEYFSLPTGNTTGTNPDIKMAFPNNVPFSGFAPIFYRDATTTFIGANTTATEILDDSILPTDYPLITNSRNYSTNTRTYRRSVNFAINDSSAAALAGVTTYITSGANVLVNAVQAGNYSGKLNTVVVSWVGRSPTSGSYIAPISSTDTRVQTAQFRKYGYQQQSVSYNLTNAAYSQPIFLLADASLTGISEATAAAITTAGINWATKTITPTASLSYDQINARIAWELAQTTNSAQADPRTIVGSQLTLATGWALVVNNGITITAGANITFMSVPTVTINGTGSIQAIYGTSAGVSTILELREVSDGSAYIIANDSTKATILYGTNATGSAQTYTAYFPPGSAGTQVLVAREKYGYQRSAEVLTLAAGGMWYTFVDIPDTGITQPTLATVQAYTSIDTPSKFYDRTAAFRLTEQGIKLGQIVTREGNTLNHGSFSKLIRADAAEVYAVSGGTITIKAASYEADSRYTKEIATPPATITAHSTEIITISIEDANGNSQCVIAGTTNNLVDVWKITNSTPVADFATGTKIASNIGNGAFRFIGEDGFKLVFNNKDNGIYRYCSMSKGDYSVGWYLYDSPTGGLTQEQSTVLNTMSSKTNEIYADVNNVTTGFVETTDSLHAIRAAVDALGTPLQASAYVAPDNTKIAEIKTKVDTLQNTDLTTVNAGIADIKGTGYDATKHNLVAIKRQASLAAALSA